jgi:DNA-binding MarR family transcriptional regulator
MTNLMLDELDRVDQAFAGNRLLSTFSTDARALIEPYGEIVDLAPDETVLTRGGAVRSSLFPFGPAMVSLVVDLSDGRTIEVAWIVSCGHAPAFSRAVVLVGGHALKVPMAALEEAKNRSPFITNLFCRFSDYLLAQVMQSGACNAFHSVTQRAARWLLTVEDRAGDRIELTQEALAGLLGVQRTSVNAVIRTLQDEGLITTGRGVVRVTDRAGLKRRTCECYDIVEEHFAAVIGPGRTGAQA